MGRNIEVIVFEENLDDQIPKKPSEFIDDTPLKLKEINNKNLLLEYNSSIYKIKKDFVDITKYTIHKEKK